MGDENLFKSARGLPANEHAKKLAKEGRHGAKKVKIFYTVIGEKKVVMLTCKAQGCYRTYFGSVTKLGRDLLEKKKTVWRDAGQWLEPFEVESKTGEACRNLQRA